LRDRALGPRHLRRLPAQDPRRRARPKLAHPPPDFRIDVVKVHPDRRVRLERRRRDVVRVRHDPRRPLFRRLAREARREAGGAVEQDREGLRREGACREGRRPADPTSCPRHLLGLDAFRIPPRADTRRRRERECAHAKLSGQRLEKVVIADR
jgi:hypothetical protein